jgi:hypothetical protein
MLVVSGNRTCFCQSYPQSKQCGRHRAITVVMLVSATVALAIGLGADKSPLLLLALVLVYGVTVPADSVALTSGTSASATPQTAGRR